MVHASVRALEPYVERDGQVKERFIGVMEEHRFSSSVRIRTAGALEPGAGTALQRRIVAAMEDVCERRQEMSRRNRGARFRDSTYRDAIDVVRRIDPAKAREMEARFGRRESLLTRIFGSR